MTLVPQTLSGGRGRCNHVVPILLQPRTQGCFCFPPLFDVHLQTTRITYEVIRKRKITNSPPPLRLMLMLLLFLVPRCEEIKRITGASSRSLARSQIPALSFILSFQSLDSKTANFVSVSQLIVITRTSKLERSPLASSFPGI